MAHQFTGYINLGIAPQAIKRRAVLIDFFCEVESVSVSWKRFTLNYSCVIV